MVVKKSVWVPVVFALAGFAAAAYLESRAFILGYAAALLFLTMALRGFHMKRHFTILAVLGLLSLAFILASTLKTDSSRGRLLIYKISSDIWKEHYIKGIGQGKFKTTYLHYQANYFSKGNHTEKELLLADNTYFAFNDYFQFVIEWGLLGVLILLTSIGLVVYGIMLVYNRHDGNLTIYHIASAQLIAMCVAAFFTHVFERWYFQLLLLGCVLIIGWGVTPPRGKGGVSYIAIGITSIVLILYNPFVHKLLYAQDYNDWEEGKSLIRVGITTEGLDFYRAAYTNLSQNGPFLEDYGYQLFVLKRHEQAITMLREALHYRVHHRMYLHLGKSYQETGKLRAAEEALLKAVHIVPNRFENRLALFDYYRAVGRNRDALHWGRSILELPVKVPSIRVDQIKLNVTENMSSIETEQ